MYKDWENEDEELKQFIILSLGLTNEEIRTLKELGDSTHEVVALPRIIAVKTRRQKAYRNGLKRREEIRTGEVASNGKRLLSSHHQINDKQGLKIFEELAGLEHITALNEGSDFGPILLLEGCYFECERRNWYYPKSVVALGGRYLLSEQRFHILMFDMGAIRSEQSEERIYTLVYST